MTRVLRKGQGIIGSLLETQEHVGSWKRTTGPYSSSPPTRASSREGQRLYLGGWGFFSEEEGELEGVERSGPAERCPRPQATQFHLRDSRTKHVTEAPCPQLRPKAEESEGQAREARGSPGSQKPQILMLPRAGVTPKHLGKSVFNSIISWSCKRSKIL